MRRRSVESEEALMQGYVEGHTDAFRRLFDALAPALHPRAWRGGERLRPWIFSIVAHDRADWLRARGRHPAEPLEGDVTGARAFRSTRSCASAPRTSPPRMRRDPL